ncbi:ribosome biogenesis GTPase A [Lachnospiraceae bacterium RM5]|nr:ribosome biogenesis GTPase A [Lachnospiraceae bacterium RM5]
MEKIKNDQNINKTNINWYPGHMTKAKRQMDQDIKLIDVIIEIIDGRIPLSSRNPDIDELGKNKSRIIIFNKADLADKEANKKWIEYFKGKGFFVVETNAKSGMGINKIDATMMEACKEKIERNKRRGIVNRPIRGMVVGIPNVGKSTFINSYAKKACTKTGNKPGVTRGKQWIRVNKNIELLDTPGILWPKFDDEKVGIKLAITGAIKDDILNITDLSIYLINYLKENYKGILNKRYEVDEDKEKVEVLYDIAEKRKCLRKNGELDYDKAAGILIDDLRSGNLGKITLD